MQSCIRRAIIMQCPTCNTENPDSGKFCAECGHGLRKPQTSDQGDYNQPVSYTLKFMAEKILTTRGSMEGERKIVTVLFADVANDMSLSENLDPRKFIR